MNTETPVVEQDYLLQKFPGKGGWTYAEIPEIPQDKRQPFGWVTVRGSIDGYPLKHYKLMPMGQGRAFLPVRAEIRKQIRKEAGDTVRVVLYRDEAPMETPEEIVECLQLEPGAYEQFEKLPPSHRKAYLDWIESAKTDETRTRRINQAIDKLLRGERLYDLGKK